MAMVDRRKFRRALTNLVINAFEAIGGKTAGRIAVSAVPAKEDASTLEIRIEDNGPGMTESVRTRVMEPFFTTKQEGTGLGLALVRQVAEQHGGGVHILSSVGTGTTVVVRLPLLKKARNANPDSRG